MHLSNFISRCRHPRVITNSRGNDILVSCGSCPDCKNRKNQRYASLSCEESRNSKYTYFVTLTYDDANLPICKVIEQDFDGKKFISYVDVTKRYLHPRKVTKRSRLRKSKTFGQVIHSYHGTINDELFTKFYEQVHSYNSKLFKKRSYKNIPYLLKEDLQKFIKRFRFQVSTLFDTEVRYFAVGEYGPVHFRPHFHLVLYFNESRLQTLLKDIIYKCWEYGNIYCKPARKSEGVASYVSTYTNSTSTLPYFLNGPQIKTFSLHSRYFGHTCDDEVRDYFYKTNRYTFDRVNIRTSTGIREVSLSYEISSYIYPRCYNYVFQTFHARKQLYTCFRQLSQIYRTTKCSELARHVLKNHDTNYNYWLLKRIDIPYSSNSLQYIDDSPTKVNICNLNLLSYKLENNLPLDDFDISIYNRVYSVLSTSRLFDNLVKSPSLDPLNPELDLINKIDRFHIERDLYNLRNQYNFIEEYVNLYDDDVRIFYPITDNDYIDTYNNNSIIKQFNFMKDCDYHEKIKHKELNDANKIFLTEPD